jgi:hypothetical protein
MSTKHFGLALAAALAASPAYADGYVNFACADGAKLTLIFERQGTGLVMLGGAGAGAGGALRLQKRHASSGLWYASPYGELRATGLTATFRMQGRAPTSCRKVR